MIRSVALLLTVLTGFSGLVYEVTWQKSLAILLGSHSEATAAVLGLFLGGLSLGYSLFGSVCRKLVERARATSRAPRLLLLYGGVECGIGLWALLFPILFAGARTLSVCFPAGPEALSFGIDVALTALLIGPPTVLMGGTIPILTQALARDLRDATRFHAFVYGFNTAGAFAGALAAGFVLIPYLGIPGVLRWMGVLNLLAGAIFLLLGSNARGRAPLPAEEGTARIEGFASCALAAVLLGFAMMSVQTVLVRVGGLAFGASHFTFAMVVAVFVLCIALGSLAVSAFERIPRAAVAVCPLLLAALLTLLYRPIQDAPYWAHLLRTFFRDTNEAFYPYFLVAFLGILAVLFVPVGLSGATLPLLFHELRRQVGDLGRVAGRLYSYNTFGSLLGALLGGYALLFWLDLHHVYRIGVAAAFAAGGLLAVRTKLVPATAAAIATAAALAALALAAPWEPGRLSAGLFRQREPLPATYRGPTAALTPASGSLVRFYDDDPATSVAVKAHPVGDRTSLAIFTNGKPDGSLISDYPTMALVALLPCLMAESCEQVFVVGYGTGVTVGEFAALESTRSVVVAEISRGVIEAAPLFDHGNQQASRSAKVRVVRSDAYRALLRSTGSYDVIASEPSNPWASGVEMLYSREFLEAARDRLRPGGVYAQWLHTYETDEETVALVLRTYASVFDEVAVWYSLGPDLLLLGFKDSPPGLGFFRIEQRSRAPDYQKALKRLGIDSLPALLAHELLPLGVVHAAGLEGTCTPSSTPA
jgi:predicted membrane-bound spermidine synthase